MVKIEIEEEEMGCLRRIVGVSRRDKMRNTDIRRKAGVEDDIVLKITRRRMRYFGHVVSMPPSRFPNMAFYGRVQGQKSRGRPRMRWVDTIKKDCERIWISIHKATQEAANRNVWRDRVFRSTRADT